MCPYTQQAYIFGLFFFISGLFDASCAVPSPGIFNPFTDRQMIFNIQGLPQLYVLWKAFSVPQPQAELIIMFQYDISRLIQQIIISHSQGPTSLTIKHHRYHNAHPGIPSPHPAHGKLYTFAEYAPFTLSHFVLPLSIIECNSHLLDKIINSLKAEPLPHTSFVFPRRLIQC